MAEKQSRRNRSVIVAMIPAFNEDRFIGSVVLKARARVSAVLVVDDGSTDSTAKIARAAGAIVIRNKFNRGKGAALNAGFQKARSLGARAVVVLDGDGQHRPDDIPAILRPVLDGKADMVVGSRFLGIQNRAPFYRRVGQKIMTAFTNITSGVQSTDSWSGFRAFSKKAVESIRFREGGWGADPEFQFLAREHGLKIVEVPITVIYEEKAKRNPVSHGLMTMNAVLRLIGQHRPLLFFGVPGAIVLVAGLLVGARVVDIWSQVHVLAVGNALISVVLTILGSLSLFTGLILFSIRGQLIEIKAVIEK